MYPLDLLLVIRYSNIFHFNILLHTWIKVNMSVAKQVHSWIGEDRGKERLMAPECNKLEIFRPLSALSWPDVEHFLSRIRNHSSTCDYKDNYHNFIHMQIIYCHICQHAVQ
jgi:hypothetical protein